MQDIDQISAVYVTFMPVIIILALWSGVWKALALYRAGKVRDVGWFVVLFLVNTLGILEILYLTIWSKRASRTQYLDA